ncbi:MAG: hypothetical protein QM621_11250 [Aeromicrobium sp.]|uniref:hypothetical protein n=1 Tax=Aeromicrobium sp. TaxID=1871063 RepID=UPI0039E32D37
MDTWGIGLAAYVVSLVGASAGGPECVELVELDYARSQAYAAASVERLEQVYVDEQAAQPDVDALLAWTERGYRLETAMQIVGSCEVVGRGEGEARLRVVDRLAPTAAVDEHGDRVPLPRDDWSERDVLLRQTDVEWRYAGVE